MLDKPLADKTVNLDRIRQLREEHDYSNKVMAELLGLKTPEKYYRREAGTYRFHVDELPKLAEIFGVPMEYFFD